MHCTCSHNFKQGKELTAALRESDKISEEVNSQAVKVKWAQNKLKTELEAHKVHTLVVTEIPCF